MLGLLLLLGWVIFGAFVWWESFPPKTYKLFWQDNPPVLVVQNLLFLIGVVSAITGWVVSSYITLRNSIKQHTINTLLQTRLSATYMDEAKLINKTFFGPSADKDPASLAFLHDQENVAVLSSVDYVLNYLEFLSVGIRHGDLDEKVLRQTMRGIVVRLYEKVIHYMHEIRDVKDGKAGNPQQLEHVTWLYDRWRKTGLKQKLPN